MRSYLLTSALVGLAVATPVPQDIDFDLAYALPNPTYTEATGVTAQIVTYDASSVFSAAAAQITASVTDTAAAVVVTTDAPANKKRAACPAQPTGAGPVPSPDTAAAFTAYPPFAGNATAAPVPKGYTKQFVNLNGSSQAYGYMGYTTLQSYDVNACAAKCNAINGCISINVYYERDPSVDPGTGSSGCANPASTTNIKCVFWGGPLDAGSATNTGQWRNQFQVVIAGSNGYTNSSVANIQGYSAPVPLGNAAINAPYDQYGTDTYLGSAMFVGAFNAQLCADACSQKSQYAVQHPPTDGTPVKTCQFFNTYILYINNTNNVQGQTCAMYSESWSSKYATNVGQYRGNDHFLIEYSFAYSNSTNPGSPNPVAAVYQAKTDILYPANSATSYCSSILGYTTPTATAIVTTVITPSATVTADSTIIDSITITNTQYSTATVTVTNYFRAKRDAGVTASTVIGSVTLQALPPAITAAAVQKRAISEPSVLSKYPASIVTSACSLAVTKVTTTSTTTVTATQTAATVYSTQEIDITSTVTATVVSVVPVTVTATVSTPSPVCSNYNFVTTDGARFISEDSDVTPYGFVTYGSVTNKAVFTVQSNGRVYGNNARFITRAGQLYYVLASPDEYADSYNIDDVLCTVGSNAVSVPSVTGALGLSCTSGGHAINFYMCPSTGQDLVQGTDSNSAGYGCTQYTLAAVPAC